MSITRFEADIGQIYLKAGIVSYIVKEQKQNPSFQELRILWIKKNIGLLIIENS